MFTKGLAPRSTPDQSTANPHNESFRDKNNSRFSTRYESQETYFSQKLKGNKLYFT